MNDYAPTLVHVTEDDIANGKPGRIDDCPIFLAMRSAGIPVVQVGSYRFYLESDENHHMLPANVIRFISDFDAGRPVSPFSFTL